MRFSTRNAFYLRVSNYRTIPLFLYLDERHTDWMDDKTLQLVIAELQPKMHGILANGRNEKKHKVHVERGDGYQYCYFLRTTTRTEIILLKQKTYSLRPPSPPPEAEPTFSPNREKFNARKRTRTKSAVPASPRNSRVRSRSASLRAFDASGGEGNEGVGSSIDDRGGRNGDSDGNRAARDTHGEGEGDDVVVKEEPEDTPDIEERGIKDWKPDVDVTFKGFGTSSVQLVVIIEPYPPLPASQYAPPSSRLSTRSASLATSRSRSRQTGTGRYGSTSLSVALDGPGAASSTPTQSLNMRNASRSVSAIPNSRQGGSGSSATPFREYSATPGPGPGPSTGTSRRRRASQTPLFIPGDTPFDEDEDDQEAHDAYEEALRVGRLRLPSVAGDRVDYGGRDDGYGVGYGDEPEGMDVMSQRLVRSSEIEEGVVRVQGGWEERGDGEVSEVMGREEPGD